MGDAGIEALAQALPQMVALTTLNLSNLSGAASGLELPSVSGCCQAHRPRLWCGALCLFVLTGYTWFDTWSSWLGDSDAETLAGVLPKMGSLMALHLRGTSSLSFALPCVGFHLVAAANRKG